MYVLVSSPGSHTEMIGVMSRLLDHDRNIVSMDLLEKELKLRQLLNTGKVTFTTRYNGQIIILRHDDALTRILVENEKNGQLLPTIEVQPTCHPDTACERETAN